MIATAIPSWQFGPPEAPEFAECHCQPVTQCCGLPTDAFLVQKCTGCDEWNDDAVMPLCMCADDMEADDEAARERADEERAEARAARWER